MRDKDAVEELSTGIQPDHRHCIYRYSAVWNLSCVKPLLNGRLSHELVL